MRPVGIVKLRDLTQGSVFHNVISMGVPSMIGFATTTVCALFDVFFVGLLGSAAVAGMTLALSFAGVLSTTNSLVGAGSVAVISRRFGEKDYKGTENAIKQTLLLKFSLAVLSGAIGLVLLRPVLSWMSADPEVIRLGFNYGVWFFIGLPFNFCSWTMFTAFRGMGDATRAMYLMVMTTTLNIALDPLMMFEKMPSSLSIMGLNIVSEDTTIGLGLGVSGAAIAKGLALLVCCVLGLMLPYSKRTDMGWFHLGGGWRPDLAVMKRIMKIGTPPCLEGIARSLAGLTTTYFVALYGTAVVAAYGFGCQILGFTIIAAVGMSLGTAAIVGNCLGACREQMAARTVKTGTAVVLAICASLGVAVFSFAPQIMGFFTDEAHVVRVGIMVLRIMVFGQVLQSVRLVLASAFSGSGNTMPPTVIGLSAEGIRISLIAVLIYVFSASEMAIWWAFLMASLIDAVVMALWFERGKWLDGRA
ncbi:MAG: MATE family efflux transporter [Candidatus Coatesbacteria bacterium]|nr:MATE family efflux transporter [Candidatus Coatesbacteria bacterium]